MIQRRLYQKQSNTIPPNDENYSDNDSWNYHYHKLIKSLEGNEIQKETIIRKRILRYFGQFKLDSETYLSIRNDINYNAPGVQIITQKIILYGVDYLTIERAKNYLSGFVTNILRIDDSHFMIEFRNQVECLAAINKCKKSKQMFLSPNEMFKNSNQGWIQMKPYYEFIFERKLMARYATNLDKKDSIASTTRQSCSFAYSEAKRRFMKSLKQDLQSNDRIKNGKERKQHNNYQNGRQKSKQRSREKNIKGFNKPNTFVGVKHVENNNCRCQCRNNRFRNRSRSRSPSIQSQRMKSNQPRKMMEEKIKQSDFKFQLYIKRRDDKTKNLNDLQPSVRALTSIEQIHNKFASQSEKNSKDNSTNNDQIDIQIISGPNTDAKNVLDPMEMDFENYLQKLKLEDSQNDYSAFDFLEMEP